MINHKESNFLNLVNSKLIKAFIRVLPFVSLLITNFMVLLIFSYFFSIKIKSFFFWELFLMGFLSSLITIRTNYVLFWKNKKNDKNSKKSNKELKTPKIGLINSIILLIKNLYFNILNDSFILTIVWISIFGLMYVLNLLKIPNNFNFQNFATTITLIGVLSGFFQFYIKNYKEQVSMKLVNSISKYLIEDIKKINFKDFMTFLGTLGDDKIKKWFKNNSNISQKKIESLISRINKIILDEDNTQQKTIKGVTYIHQTFLSFKIDASYLFDYLDYYKEFKKQNGESLNKQLLKECYKVYFKRKFEEFKEELNNEELTEIRKIIFSSIFFFDEVLADLEKILLEFRTTENKELSDFRAFYEKFTYDCIYYMLDILLNFKQENQKGD